MPNKILTAIIAEDNIENREQMVIYANRIGISILSTVASGEWLIDDCIRYNPDIVFLKNDLNGTPGLIAYERLIDYGIKPYLIIMADELNTELMLAGLQLNCLDFLNKPVNLVRMTEAVDKVRMTLNRDLSITHGSPGRIISLKSSYKTIYVNEHNLIYASKLKGEHRTIIYAEGSEDEIISTSSLKDIMSQCSSSFFMPNQSNIINMNYVSKVFASENTIGNYIILLHNAVEIDLPRRKRKLFEEAYKLNNKDSSTLNISNED
ncbi:LytR/AlgR family response regulator transcription factor [Paenibacillus sp. 1A_MP2]|uniref:LytR/AlgR family response regulator transcription factor n=1 Tax=Paenibacillus sp. 1A_MP2 TaxID=3457495 RepID=UPI003FCED9EE